MKGNLRTAAQGVLDAAARLGAATAELEACRTRYIDAERFYLSRWDDTSLRPLLIGNVVISPAAEDWYDLMEGSRLKVEKVVEPEAIEDAQL